MEIELEYSFNLALRYKRPFSIVAVDFDSYKDYVAHYGRKTAGLAHKLLAEHIRHSCRTVDRTFRCGVDTCLLMLLPETLFEGANILAERVVNSFADRSIPHSKSEHNILTISASPLTYEPDTSFPAGWTELLDEVLLYINVAQGQGGNQVCYKAKITEMAS